MKVGMAALARKTPAKMLFGSGPGMAAPVARSLLRILTIVAHLLSISCAGTDRRATGKAVDSEPAADPSAKMTIQSSSRPTRDGPSQDLGHSVAETLLTPVSDCELPLCTGDPSAQLVDAIRGRAADSRACYEDALKASPSLAGRVIVAIRVTHDGQACPIRVESNELASSKTLVSCIRTLLERSYPKPNGGCLDLNLPLKFVPEFIESDAGTPGDANRHQEP